MRSPGADTEIKVSEGDLPTNINKWNPTIDTSIYINDQSQSISHRKFIRRWNRLSRLQRSIVYAVVVIAATVGVLYFTAREIKPEEKPNVSQLPVEPVKNLSLVNEPAAEAVLSNNKPAFEVELNERPVFTGPTNAKQYAVVESFRHAWKGYKTHAWGHDNLKPLSGMPSDWFSLGLTIVDALDTAFIMGLTEEFSEGREWVSKELVFTRNKDVNFFEVTIRVLGGLLTNYHYTQDDMFLKKAEELGDRLMAAFNSPSGIPYSDVNLGARTAHAPEWSHYSTTAEVTTVQLEFRELSRASNNPAFEDAAAAVSEKIHQLPKKHGLVPIFINPNTGQFLPHATVTLGARGDSYYEYLLKQWLHTGKTINYLLDDYLTAIEGVREFLARRSTPNKYLFIGELLAGSETFNPKMDHLTCFLPGTLALGHANGLPDWHMTMAEELMTTCYLTYKAHPTFLAPEITHFNLASATSDMYTKTADAHSLLRPEFIESLFYMYQLTGNTTYQDWGWQIYQGFEKYAKVPNGYTSLANVKSEKPVQRDMMESFFLSETLKYLYLLFSDDRYLIDLSKYVFNSEAHPLPIHKS
ncbi:endoplasmic reticulum mannosyl-oligosaccharide 1,2-alpha-mannosidase isoform X1 [Leguminivora glycinivorella]|uniref:endoplasmic reticulum mannosyl-oligosaccharide 1,2-alpha-mannosidase isoform X1 n=1 Tax=Leguminivora glycinivorella TaxID=1035111 RepID=UPI00200C53B8|nr:endoplasmic reticulum mannosyl-oligosaccharide 1,2-alpha-mannosidase isoform X1 [Leguminivora glycinivorella]XP_048004531.1 endoplasmic reticulum mannosyl-oligosaccharide 1,2-alpha-mannosidase isoform X1 [Leguminivora glycinivorella]